jgi:hypothetical protein
MVQPELSIFQYDIHKISKIVVKERKKKKINIIHVKKKNLSTGQRTSCSLAD